MQKSPRIKAIKSQLEIEWWKKRHEIDFRSRESPSWMLSGRIAFAGGILRKKATETIDIWFNLVIKWSHLVRIRHPPSVRGVFGWLRRGCLPSIINCIFIYKMNTTVPRLKDDTKSVSGEIITIEESHDKLLLYATCAWKRREWVFLGSHGWRWGDILPSILVLAYLVHPHCWTQTPRKWFTTIF